MSKDKEEYWKRKEAFNKERKEIVEKFIVFLVEEYDIDIHEVF
jgi:hypothetical protein